MERWKLYAAASAAFAGLTPLLAKAGLRELGADLGLSVRTLWVAAFVLLATLFTTGAGASALTLRQAGWTSHAALAASALATALSWLCYSRALHEGHVSTVTLIDKSSLLVTLALAVLILGESFTWRSAVGAALVFAGLLFAASDR